MDTNITLLGPPSYCVENDNVEQNLGLAYIAALLVANKFAVNITELTGINAAEFESRLQDIPRSDIYGISIYSTNYANAKRIVQFLKERDRNPYIVVGGPHPSVMAKETLDDLGTDAVIIGEGEQLFLDLVNAYREGRSMRGLFKLQSAQDINKLPFPDRSLVDQEKYSRRFHGNKTISLLSSRGCNYRCVHCNSPINGGGSEWGARFRCTENVIREIRSLKDLGYKYMRFNDDNFTYNPRLIELLQQIKREGIRYRVFSRLESLTENTLNELSASGCDFISIGIESLNERNLNFLGKKGMLNHIGNLKKAKDIGTTIRASFMVGLPYDTDESIERDFEKAAMLNFDEFSVYALIPYPGTKLWSESEKLGYRVIDRDFTQYVQLGVNKCTTFVLEHTDPETGYKFGPDDVRRWYQLSNDILSRHKKHVKESTIAT